MNFKNRLVKEKKPKKTYTWASTAKTAVILKVSAAKLYEYRKKPKRNQLIEGIHYKRDEYRLCDRGSPILYNLEKTCKRIHFIDLEIFTDPNGITIYKFFDHFDTRHKEIQKYYPTDENGYVDITNSKDFTKEGVYIGS
tara:strand:- start:61 stop:477 length:417 start_codon:yes stop_codon:yes gene_type:complete